MIVYKYPFNDAWINVPEGRIVLVAAQTPGDSWPTVWVEQDPDAKPTIPLVVHGTGHPIDADSEHVGSAVCLNGALVWHVYRVAS